MKTLLRTSGLMAILALTALTTAGTATPPGTCYTTCVSNTGFSTVQVQWTATQEECCGGVIIPPCPAGYHAANSSYQPYLKPRAFCPPRL
jgi:hypothetical protein